LIVHKSRVSGPGKMIQFLNTTANSRPYRVQMDVSDHFFYRVLALIDTGFVSVKGQASIFSDETGKN
jgi:hypothetical protein